MLENKNEMWFDDENKNKYDIYFNCIIILMSNTLLHSSQGLKESLHISYSKINMAENSPIETTDDL